MTKKDFFRLIIKIFGLYTVISIFFSVLPGNIFMAFRDINVFMILWIIGSLTLITALFMFLIYKPDTVIKWLKLDRGFDEERIDIQNFNHANILKLSVIVIGGMLLIRNIQAFLSSALFAFKSSASTDFSANSFHFGSLKDYTNWTISFLNIIIGYLMLTNYNFLIRILDEKTSKKNDNIDEI